MKRTLTFLLLPVFASFLVLGCDGTGTAPNASTDAEPDRASEVENLTGKDLYRGFLTGEGQVGAMLPEIFDRPETLDEQTLKITDQQFESMSREEIRKAHRKARQVPPKKRSRDRKSFTHRLIDRIEQNNSGFFARFELRVKSGDPAEVQKALASMSRVTTSAMTKILGVSEKSLFAGRKVRRGSGDGKCVVNSGVVLDHVRNYNVVRVIDTVVQVDTNLHLTVVLPLPPVVGTKQAGETADLNQEMLADRVADRFGVH